MKTFRILIRLIFLVSSVTCMYAQQILSESENTRVREEITALNKTLVGYAEHADLEAMFRSIADREGVIIRDGRLLGTKADAYTEYQQGFQDVASLEYHFDHEIISVLSTEIVLVVSDGRSVLTTPDGRTFETPFAQTLIFGREDGEWKVIHAHASSP
ncbi:nuclear transport factor 2 family protein [bacterium]|nr:nuclear transport factor 2 family protein [bacterium]